MKKHETAKYFLLLTKAGIQIVSKTNFASTESNGTMTRDNTQSRFDVKNIIKEYEKNIPNSKKEVS
jgi:hypothetical protein